MKRFLPVMFLLCLGAGSGIRGWKAPTGQWICDEKTGEIKAEGNGGIEHATSPIGDFEMMFRICIDEYTDAHNMAGVSFRIVAPARYKLSFRSPNRVMFDKTWKEGEETQMNSLVSVPMSIPKGEWIPVKLTVRGGSMQARIGKMVTLQATDPDPLPPGTLALLTFRAKARFKVKKVDVKDK